MEAVEKLSMKMKPMHGQLRSYFVSSLLKFVSILDPYRAVLPRSNLMQAPMKDLLQAGSVIFADGFAST